ncbi:MAG: hypothetical protein JWN02_2747 [Acidobacteria bacterium]|nr:hypothetical protein [Acidobacteriota bacterium]
MTFRTSFFIVSLAFVTTTATAQAKTPSAPDAVTPPTYDVAAAYARISGETADEAKGLYQELSLPEKEKLWTLHLTTFLAENPELTDEQRSVILEGLGLISTGILQVDRESAAWELAVHRPLLYFETRARAAFPHQVARALLTDIRHGALAAAFHPGRVEALDAPDCGCSTEDDWCGSGTGSSQCIGGSKNWCTPSTWGCGTFFTSPCNGLCW